MLPSGMLGMLESHSPRPIVRLTRLDDASDALPEAVGGLPTSVRAVVSVGAESKPAQRSSADPARIRNGVTARVVTHWSIMGVGSLHPTTPRLRGHRYAYGSAATLCPTFMAITPLQGSELPR